VSATRLTQGTRHPRTQIFEASIPTQKQLNLESHNLTNNLSEPNHQFALSTPTPFQRCRGPQSPSCFTCIVSTVCPPKSDPLNVWLWQVQTCTALHIIKRAQALVYLEYCHQILYKSVVPFSRFSIFTKCCQKVELPAALLTRLLCALTVFCVNVQHFSSNGVR